MVEKEKIDNFIGWVSDNGNLKVVGVFGKNKSGAKLYKVTCKICSQDPELFPLGYFIAQKSDLLKPSIPCGCAEKVRWTKEQYLLKTKREAEKNNIIIHGFAEDYKGVKTRVRCECAIDGYIWTSPMNKILTSRGCIKCKYKDHGKLLRTPELIAFNKCETICIEMNYDPIGFVDGYKGANKTRFEYICLKHGLQNVSYNGFVNNGTRCKSCAIDASGFYGRYPERDEEQDYLYVLNFNDKFIKVGRSFDVNERINNGLKRESKIDEIHKLRIYTATHKEIFDLEQELLDELRKRGFQYSLNWTNECFDKDCIHILYKLLDNCDYDRIL